MAKAPSWTREQAHEMARRSAAVRAQRAADRKALPAPQPAGLAPQTPAQLAIQAQHETVAEEIAHIRRLLDPVSRPDNRCPTCKRAYGIDAADRAKLVQALDVLLDRQRILHDIPLPGSRKHGAGKATLTRPPGFDPRADPTN